MHKKKSYLGGGQGEEGLVLSFLSVANGAYWVKPRNSAWAQDTVSGRALGVLDVFPPTHDQY